MQTATYTKLKTGAWGVKLTGYSTVPGVVTVTKRDGSRKTETIDRVLWQGNGVAIASISESRAPARSGYGGSGYGSRCKGCRGPIVSAPHHRAMGGYCGSCAFDEFDC